MNVSKGMSDIMSRFTFHKPDAEGKAKMSLIRQEVRKLAYKIDSLCPESREKATALTHLATVMMNANSAIVQEYPIDEADLATWETDVAPVGTPCSAPEVSPAMVPPMENLNHPTSSEVAQAVNAAAEAHTEGNLE